jgi:hypothetical protein
VAGSDVLVVARDSGGFYALIALDAVGGAERWRVPVDGFVDSPAGTGGVTNGPAAVAGGVVYVAGETFVYAIG